MIISAPFGNYLNFPGCVSTIGTYTADARWGRWWRTALTLRYNRQQQSYINKIGLRNPGIRSVKTAKNKIISIHGFTSSEWDFLVKRANWLNPTAIEFNLSCPNVPNATLPLIAIKKALERNKVICKLGPVKWLEIGEQLYNVGVRSFHLCNTIPSPGGGISGKPLKQYSLWAIEDFRKRWGEQVTLIGGGGVYSLQDVQDYKNAGANDVAIGTFLLNPLNWKKIKVMSVLSPNLLFI